MVKTTKRNEVHPGEVSVTPTSIGKAMSSGGSGATEVMAQPLVIGTYTITTVVR